MKLCEPLHGLGAQHPGRAWLTGVQCFGSKARKHCEGQLRLLFKVHSTPNLPLLALDGGRHWPVVKRFPDESSPVLRFPIFVERGGAAMQGLFESEVSPCIDVSFQV